MLPVDELRHFVLAADSYQNDSRSWPDPTEPRAARPPDPRGCTCPAGQKLDCPIHGMHALDEQYANDWAIPEGSPVGYPQDQPRSWTMASSVQAPLLSQESNDLHPDHSKQDSTANDAAARVHDRSWRISKGVEESTRIAYQQGHVEESAPHRTQLSKVDAEGWPLPAFGIPTNFLQRPATGLMMNKLAWEWPDPNAGKPQPEEWQPGTHKLDWKQGQPGKGMVRQDGTVWTWPTEHMYPTHQQVDATSEANRAAPTKWGTQFHIEPHGRVWQYGSNRGLDPDDRFNLMKANAGLWFGQPGDEPQAQADQFGHAQAILPRQAGHADGWFMNGTHACPGCGQNLVDNAARGYTSVDDGVYGQNTYQAWDCGNCGHDFRPGENRPRPHSQQYRLPIVA